MCKSIFLAATLTVISTDVIAQSFDFEDLLEREGANADLSQLLQPPSLPAQNALTVLRNQVDAGLAMSGTGSDEAVVTDGLIEAAEWSTANQGRSAAVADQILIRFAPNVTDEDIAAVIADYDLEVIDVYVGLGAINATADLSEYFGDFASGAQLSQEDRLRATIDATNSFNQDARIIAATPNIAIQANDLETATRSVLVPRHDTETDFSAGEQIDWGIDDIKVRGLWEATLPFAPRVGVIDVGFASHEDLAFGRPLTGPRDDHGNHVSGIICAKHNEMGVTGVVPDCQIIAKTGNFLPVTSPSDNVQSFMLLFSQILLSMDEFVTDRDEVEAFNASLGYNWEANFGIDPSEDGNELIRANIQNQAIFLLPVLDAAQERDILIFSAAGNDSRSDDPRDAVFASPFNWAARTACELLGNCAGVIVEAHGSDGKRAPFSNINGDISCPGVDILSTVASGPEDYARMSGTSMASPYCTGGYVMFSMLRPGYSSQEALDCLTASGIPQPHGTPRMDLEAALEHCEERA